MALFVIGLFSPVSLCRECKEWKNATRYVRWRYMIKIASASIIVLALAIPGIAFAHTAEYNQVTGQSERKHGGTPDATCDVGGPSPIPFPACNDYIKGFFDGWYTTCPKHVFSQDYDYTLCRGDPHSYQQGYNQGIHDWNMFAQDLSHHFICPYNDTSAYCRGYDAALKFETSDQ